MLRSRDLKFLAVIAGLGIAFTTATAQGAETRRRRMMQGPDDPYLAFVPGKPLLFAAERGGSVLYLRYPDLEVDRMLETPANQKLDVIKPSPGGSWIAGFFEQSNFREGGTLHVWSLSTGETRLRLDDASGGVDFLDDGRLILWQPKSGITQWALAKGEQVGPVITAVTSININVDSRGIYLSRGGRYLLAHGTCRGDDPKTDKGQYCIFDLSDGSTIGWLGVDSAALFGVRALGERILVTSRPFGELVGVLDIPTGSATLKCRPVGQDRELCQDEASVSLIDTVAAAEAEQTPVSTEPPQPAPAPKSRLGFREQLRQIKEAGKAMAEGFKEARAAKSPGVLWTIRAGKEIGRYINSCALSEDGRWVAVGSMGVTVTLYDTTQLQSKKNALNGSWEEPVLVRQFEMPGR